MLEKISIIGKGYNPEDINTLNTLFPDIIIHFIRNEENLKSDLAQSKYIVHGGDKKIKVSHLEKCPDLELISFVGTGYEEFIDERIICSGIKICNTPGILSMEVAELTLGLMILVERKLLANASRSGLVKEVVSGRSLSDCRIGILGMGAIGQATSKMVSRIYKKVVWYHSRSRNVELEKSGVIQWCSIEDLFSFCDILVLAIPCNSETEGIVNSNLLFLPESPMTLINPAAARLVCPISLKQALEIGKVSACAFDGYWEEPIPSIEKDKYGFLSMPPEQFLILPHIGAKTSKAWERITSAAIKNLSQYINNKRATDN